MNKNTFILLGIIAVLIWALTRSCDSQPKPDKVEGKADQSLKADSLKQIETSKLVARYDSLIHEKLISDSLHKVKINSLSIQYNALRTIVKTMKPVKVDSSGQVVNNIPAASYNASVEQGTMCDSLIMYLDSELAVKDSIAKYYNAQYVAEKKLNSTNTQALSDLKALEGEEKKSLAKAKKLNKKIPVIAAISAIAGYIILTLTIK